MTSSGDADDSCSAFEDATESQTNGNGHASRHETDSEVGAVRSSGPCHADPYSGSERQLRNEAEPHRADSFSSERESSDYNGSEESRLRPQYHASSSDHSSAPGGTTGTSASESLDDDARTIGAQTDAEVSIVGSPPRGSSTILPFFNSSSGSRDDARRGSHFSIISQQSHATDSDQSEDFSWRDLTTKVEVDKRRRAEGDDGDDYEEERTPRKRTRGAWK